MNKNSTWNDLRERKLGNFRAAQKRKIERVIISTIGFFLMIIAIPVGIRTNGLVSLLLILIGLIIFVVGPLVFDWLQKSTESEQAGSFVIVYCFSIGLIFGGFLGLVTTILQGWSLLLLVLMTLFVVLGCIGVTVSWRKAVFWRGKR